MILSFINTHKVPQEVLKTEGKAHISCTLGKPTGRRSQPMKTWSDLELAQSIKSYLSVLTE